MIDAELHSPPPNEPILLTLEPDGAMTTRTIDAARFWLGRGEPVGSEKNCIGTVSVILRVVEGKKATDDERAKVQDFTEYVSRVVRAIVHRVPPKPRTDGEVKP